MSEYLVEMRGICKRFPGVQALQDVDFRIRPGEIVCLLGENGAGKSTLMKVLTGVYQPDGGSLYFQGEPFKLTSPQEAYKRGINIIFQEFNLCPNLSAMENLFLGNENRTARGFFSWKKTRIRAKDFFCRLKIAIEPDTPVGKLGVAQQQMVEIAKALSYDTKLLIMDEPTSALADKEIKNLFSIMKDLKSQGIAIIFISHKLEEVMEITDRITVLRDGCNCGDVNTSETTENGLVSMMVGRELEKLYTQRTKNPSGDIVLRVEELSGPPFIDSISFGIHRGEILGLAGLVGAGRTELAKLLIGAVKKESGRVFINGDPVDINNPVDAVSARIAYLPEDRKNLGLVLPMNIRENTTMSIHPRIQGLFKLLNKSKERQITEAFMSDIQIKATSMEQRVETLSGGNQQKVVIAKSLAVEPLILILDEPTRGIDVGAKAEVHNIISELADQGVSIIIISSELPEILHLSDRILVMHEGKITGDFLRSDVDQEIIMHAAIGSS